MVSFKGKISAIKRLNLLCEATSKELYFCHFLETNQFTYFSSLHTLKLNLAKVKARAFDDLKIILASIFEKCPSLVSLSIGMNTVMLPKYPKKARGLDEIQMNAFITKGFGQLKAFEFMLGI